jgi:uncharacterized protein (TIGR02147 family)
MFSKREIQHRGCYLGDRVISIFEYSDYRLFLRDRLRAQKADGRFIKKADGRPITYKSLGEAAGFTSKGFLTQILQGRTNLPERMIGAIAKALDLRKKERDYFALLVRFNQAKRATRRAEWHQRIREGFKTEAKAPGLERFEYYRKWYYSAVRSLLGYFAFRGDYADLARQLEPAITPAQAKRAVGLLERLGLIQRKEDGLYHPSDRGIATGGVSEEAAVSHALIQFQRETMDLAKDALEKAPESEPSASTLTLGLSEAGCKALEEKLRILRRELAEIARSDQGADRVIQVNLHAFPLTRAPRAPAKRP